MKLSRLELRKLILGEISLVKDEAIFKKRRIPGIQPGEESHDSEVLHSAQPDDEMDPGEAVGLGYEIGKHHCSHLSRSRFVNEMGNEINIMIKHQDCAVGEITITMSGPDSIMENTITHMEAEMLYAALGKFLNH